MSDMDYTVIIEPADDGTFGVYVPDLPGCVSSGVTRDEAVASIREAIRGHVELLRESGQPISHTYLHAIEKGSRNPSLAVVQALACVYTLDEAHLLSQAAHGLEIVRTYLQRRPDAAPSFLRLMLWASSIAVPLYYVYRLPVAGGVLRTVAPISMHEHWRWRWLDTFDWYTPRYQFKYLYPEVFRWFTRRGMTDIEIFDDPIRIRGTRNRAAEGRPAAAVGASHASRPADVHVAPARPAV